MNENKKKFKKRIVLYGSLLIVSIFLMSTRSYLAQKWQREDFAVAIEKERLDEVLQNIKNGVDVNFKMSSGGSPLHLAARSNNAQIVDALLKEGADVNVLNAQGDPPLHGTHSADCARSLIKYGARARMMNWERRTFLYQTVAVSKGLKLIELYLKAGLPVETDDLEYVGVQDREELFSLLLESVEVKHPGRLAKSLGPKCQAVLHQHLKRTEKEM